MPVSIDPVPGENEIECARCGAVFPMYLNRCPECGVNLYEPEDDLDEEAPRQKKSNSFSGIRDLFHRLTGKPYAAEELFGNAINGAHLFNDLLQKVGGDHQTAERLIAFEQTQKPGANRHACIQAAIERWEKDNRSKTSG